MRLASRQPLLPLGTTTPLLHAPGPLGQHRAGCRRPPAPEEVDQFAISTAQKAAGIPGLSVCTCEPLGPHLRQPWSCPSSGSREAQCCGPGMCPQTHLRSPGPGYKGGEACPFLREGPWPVSSWQLDLGTASVPHCLPGDICGQTRAGVWPVEGLRAKVTTLGDRSQESPRLARLLGAEATPACVSRSEAPHPPEAPLPGAPSEVAPGTQRTPAKRGTAPTLPEREEKADGQAGPSTSSTGGQGLPTGPGGPQGGRLASRRGWARAGPLRPPLVQDTRTSTYLTGSHRVFLFYYRQSQGQPLLSNKRNALNGLFLACPELGAGAGLPGARAVWTRTQTRWASGSPRLHPPQLPLPARDGTKQELGGLGCGDKGSVPQPKLLLPHAERWPSPLLQNVGCPGNHPLSGGRGGNGQRQRKAEALLGLHEL